MRYLPHIAGFLLAAWMVWTSYRITGLEVRMNLQEASQHWQEEPPARNADAR